MAIVWLDETWVKAGHHANKSWTDGTLNGTFPGPTGRVTHSCSRRHCLRIHKRSGINFLFKKTK